MTTTRFTIVTTLLLLGACGAGANKDEDPAASTPSASAPSTGAQPAAADLPEGVHAVLCGCVVLGVGRCGNYVVVDDETLPLGGDIGLGKMEFCGRSGLTATLEGDVQDGVFVATAYALRE